jgi:hypothetical protein
VIFPLCLAAAFLWQRQWKNASLLLGLGVAPLVLFLYILAVIFGHTGVTFTPPFEHLPFAGLFYYHQTPHKFWLLVLIVLLPTSGNLGFLAWDLVRRHFNAMTLVWAANLGVLVFLSHSSYIELISCGRAAIPAVLAGLLYGIRTRNRTLLWSLLVYALTFALYFVSVFIHVDSFLI